jgi:hypothetical protein
MMFKPDDFKFSVSEHTREWALRVKEETYAIRFDFAALYTFYKAIGINPVIEVIGSDPMRWAALLFVGLLRFQSEIKLEIVQSWYNSQTFLALVDGTGKAFRDSLPAEPTESQEAAPDPQSA